MTAGKVILVDDDDRVVRTNELVQLVNRRGTITAAARELGISRSWAYKHLIDHGWALDRPRSTLKRSNDGKD